METLRVILIIQLLMLSFTIVSFYLIFKRIGRFLGIRSAAIYLIYEQMKTSKIPWVKRLLKILRIAFFGYIFMIIAALGLLIYIIVS